MPFLPENCKKKLCDCFAPSLSSHSRVSWILAASVIIALTVTFNQLITAQNTHSSSLLLWVIILGAIVFPMILVFSLLQCFQKLDTHERQWIMFNLGGSVLVVSISLEASLNSGVSINNFWAMCLFPVAVMVI